MSQFFISCKESRIENNRSFYGCFYLGPFEPSQSLTIANTLRRTLLSEIYGLGIVSVEIDGASHEYSSLPGVRDSILDILLNLKEIILKKTTRNFKPQIGYLRVRGPGVVRASHLRLPPNIQLVDPNQYIATLAENGFLNLKFIVQYGNKWISSRPSSATTNGPLAAGSSGLNKASVMDNNSKLNIHQFSSNPYNLHLKKRRLILKKLKNVSYKNDMFLNKNLIRPFGAMLPQSSLFVSKFCKRRQLRSKRFILQNLLIKKYPAINLKTLSLNKFNKSIPFESQISNNSTLSIQKNKLNFKKMIFLNSKPLTIDAIFNPISKVNYIIEPNDFKEAPSKLQDSGETAELYEMLSNCTPGATDPKGQWAKGANRSAKTSNSFLKANIYKKDLNTLFKNELLIENQMNASLSGISKEIAQTEIETILELKREINNLKKETIKHNIILEIWTNGSIHPRDALYQGFKNVIKLFAKLKKINTFGINTFAVNSLEKMKEAELNTVASSDLMTNLNKKIKIREINPPLLHEFIALDETAFLSTYVNPKLKNYYLNTQSLDNVLKTPFLKNTHTEHFVSPQTNIKKEIMKSKDIFNPKKVRIPSYNQADISILNLSLRSYTGLKRLKINRIEDLIQLSKQDIIASSEKLNFKLNDFILIEIEKSLENIGLALKSR
jgi:DNA-directed RNA polymerase alpha subunit